MGIKVIITGATGMVGEGVLLECLKNPEVESVLIINRRTAGVIHPKLTEIIHTDFYNLNPIADQLTGYDACYFCLGISSVGMKEPDYFKTTYTLTMHVAEILCLRNPNMVFCYISGAGTDSSEKGRQMWARVKGKTENDLMKMPCRNVYAFRPGFIKPIEGQKFVNKLYKYINWMFPIFRPIFPGGFCRVTEIADAMIYVTTHDVTNKVVTGKDIIALASR
ncbi:NAD-dependent epimerase/dehydratase family protein [Taibaiella soli]|uniref:Epimerase n=1 Tax=Taibaiella soli TaxID=1649169 RepID=A0A2W2B474_9BACT|nr:NAD-dependent epimerase/dehydratase family protein [Taibaiella soli]PZF71059.1 epimerase [Taibaiella soli]